MSPRVPPGGASGPRRAAGPSIGGSGPLEVAGTDGPEAPIVMPNDTDAPTPSGAFEVAERARWEDVDLVGIVRYSAYTRLLDVVEAELLRAAGLEYPRLQSLYQLWLVRRVLHLEYHVPARFDAPLRVALWIERTGTSALTLGVSVRDGAGEVVHAGGHLVLVAVDARTLVKRPLPGDLVARLAAVTARREVADGPPLRSL